jgi:hypothetical protein
MLDLFSKENVVEFKKAIDDLKEVLTNCFTDKEKKKSSLALTRELNGSRSPTVDLLSEENPEKLIEYVKYNNNVTYSLVLKTNTFVGKVKNTVVAHFRLIEMPGCCGVVISTGAWTSDEFRKRGIGTALNRFRMAIAKATGYATMMCTAIDDGITEKILAKNGWTRVSRFVNRRTNNPISIFTVPL